MPELKLMPPASIVPGVVIFIYNEGNYSRIFQQATFLDPQEVVANKHYFLCVESTSDDAAIFLATFSSSTESRAVISPSEKAGPVRHWTDKESFYYPNGLYHLKIETVSGLSGSDKATEEGGINTVTNESLEKIKLSLDQEALQSVKAITPV